MSELFGKLGSLIDTGINAVTGKLKGPASKVGQMVAKPISAAHEGNEEAHRIGRIKAGIGLLGGTPSQDKRLGQWLQENPDITYDQLKAYKEQFLQERL